MYRHSPINRNQRSKGFKLKHVLQICVLVAVCFWLLYQVKHSHDKMKQFNENDAKISQNVERNNVIVKFGRKDLNPQEKGTNKDDGEVEEESVEEDKNEEQDKHEEESGEEIKHEQETGEENKHEEESGEEIKHEEKNGEDNKHEEESGEEDEHEETGEEDKLEEGTGEEDKLEEGTGEEDKHEEEIEEDIKAEEKEDEGRGDGDDEVNEHEEQKDDSDVDREEEFIDEEKEKDDSIEKESEEKDDDNKNTQTKIDSSTEDHDHDERSRNTREAREEQYKGDDASSAVTHDGETIGTVHENGSTEKHVNLAEHENKSNIIEEGNIGQNTTNVNVLELETPENGTSTLDKEKSSEVLNSISQDNSSFTSTVVLESHDQAEAINNTDIHRSSSNKETEIILSDPSDARSATEGDTTAAVRTLELEQADNATINLENTQLYSNSLTFNEMKDVEGNSEESLNSSMNSEIASENILQFTVPVEKEDGSESTIIGENTSKVENEKPENIEGTEGKYDNSDSSNTENADEVQHDSIDASDSSIPVEDKEHDIDLDTLPEIRTEGSNSEEVAEE